MLADVDLALRALFRGAMTTLGAGTSAGVTEGQIGIQPPDDDWASDVNSFAPKRGLNVYLADLRENRKLRSNERTERSVGDTIFRDPAPMRIDCHYVISAWSAATDRKTKTIDEHRVLAEALHVLSDARAITVAGMDLPTTIAPAEGFPKLAEFWGTMGAKRPWRPAIQLVVTVPVQGSDELAGPEVTTRLTEYTHGVNGDAPELFVQIGGVVRDATAMPPTGIGNAWVRLEDVGGAPLQATRTNASGEFSFSGVAPGGYQLRVRAPGRDEPPVTSITVPSPTGRYDLEFS